MNFARLSFLSLLLPLCLLAADQPEFEYKLLATSKTSTMEKEINEAAQQGYVFASTMGGETSFGGNESVVVMVKEGIPSGLKEYKLLATRKTSTMQKELTQAGAEGFQYSGLTVFDTTFGGSEVCVILHRDPASPPQLFEYRLLATSKTSTMQKELTQAGEAGFKLMGMVVGETSFGGDEVVSILARKAE